MIGRFTENEHIESITKLQNGHFLLVIKEPSRTKLSRGFDFDDAIKYSDPYYNSKGWLELFDIVSLKRFLSNNKRHLSEELGKNMLEFSEGLTYNPEDNCVKLTSTRLSLFANTSEKISIEKLKTLKCWTEQFLNPKIYTDFLPAVFGDIFRVLLPFEKREKIKGSPFTQVVEENGHILIPSLYDRIGQSFQKYHDFMMVCMKLVNWDNLGKVAKEPEVLGSNWDILNEDNANHLKALSEWLQSVIFSKNNPIDGNYLNELDIKKLEVASDCLVRSYEMLKPDMKKSFVFS